MILFIFCNSSSTFTTFDSVLLVLSSMKDNLESMLFSNSTIILNCSFVIKCTFGFMGANAELTGERIMCNKCNNPIFCYCGQNVQKKDEVSESTLNDLLVALKGTPFEGKDTDSWYWYTDPREGDIWYPCYLMNNGQVMIDGHKRDANLCCGVSIIKAVMPE